MKSFGDRDYSVPFRTWLLVGSVTALGVWMLVRTGPGDARAGGGEITYHGGVERILRTDCRPCHRSGGVAPFPLETYADAYRYRALVYSAVEERRMPPWFANPVIGDWSNDRSLSEPDRERLLRWIDDGSLEGDAVADLPPYDEEPEWWIGDPDTVLALSEPVQVPATGVLQYQYRYVRTTFPEDRWIQAVEIRPTAPEVVHHVLVMLEDPPPGIEALDGSPVGVADSIFGLGLDGFFAAHVPGHQGVAYPYGYAKRLPAGGVLKFQLHYTPYGHATEDQTRIGLIFSDRPPEYRVETGAAINRGFVIPAGSDNYEVTAVQRFDSPVRILGFLPHMHLRGKAFRFEVHYPDGIRRTVLDVPRYDFNWQDEYVARVPIELPEGSWLRATGWFDNSDQNPVNPDPTREVRFGEQTYEEMMNGYFHYVVLPRDTAEEERLSVVAN